MDYKFKKGHHYCCPFFIPKVKFRSGSRELNYKLSLVVNFSKTCRYNIDADQSDVNKLWGISYGLHHNQSDRIGWRYVPDLDGIQLVRYSYVQGKRLPSAVLCTVPFDCDIKIDVSSYYIHAHGVRYLTMIVSSQEVNYETLVECLPTDKFNLSYTLGPYFGGNRKAPHLMTLDININNEIIKIC